MEPTAQTPRPSPANIHRAYLRTLFILIAAMLLFILTLNLLTDPYNAYRLIGGGSLAQYKTGIATRIGKSEAIHRRPWDVVILGNSRVEVGFDPENPAWNGQRVFNAGLPGAEFTELAQAGRIALENPGLKRLILCIDLSAFDAAIAPNPDQQRTLLNPGVNTIDYNLANLLGNDATERSIGTIRNWLGHHPSPWTPRGFSTNELKTNGRADWVLVNYYDFADPQHQRREGKSALDPHRLAALADLLDTAARRGVRVDVIDPPIHVISFERLNLKGNLQMHEEFLRAVVRIVADHHSHFPADASAMWDFRTYNAFTTESIPAENETATHMKWYWDPDHFKKELGDLVIDRIASHIPSDGMDLASFGDILTSDNIDAHLMKLRSDRQIYLDEHPDVRAMFPIQKQN